MLLKLSARRYELARAETKGNPAARLQKMHLRRADSRSTLCDDSRAPARTRTMIQGSCLCGAMRFEIDEAQIIVINNCHCSYCRKVSGAAFGTFVQLPGSSFRWLSGEQHLATFESTPGNRRAFCKVCGSRAPQSADWKEHVTVPA